MKWQACPICHGRMVVQAGFYSGQTSASNVAVEPCRTCDGFGVIGEPTITAQTPLVRAAVARVQAVIGFFAMRALRNRN